MGPFPMIRISGVSFQWWQIDGSYRLPPLQSSKQISFKDWYHTCQSLLGSRPQNSHTTCSWSSVTNTVFCPYQCAREWFYRFIEKADPPALQVDIWDMWPAEPSGHLFLSPGYSTNIIIFCVCWEVKKFGKHWFSDCLSLGCCNRQNTIAGQLKQ